MTFKLEYSVKDNGAGAKLNYDLNLDLNGQTTLKDLSSRIRLAQILIAKQVLREEQSDGFDKKPIIRIDGVSGKKEEQVKSFGKIEYYSRISDLEVLLQVYKSIEDRSPTRSGLYRNSNYVFINNRLVAQNFQQFSKLVADTKVNGIGEINEIRFLNVTPYAARLEFRGVRRSTRGLSKGKNVSKGRTGKSRSKKTLGRSIKKPNGAYYLASRTLSSVKGFFSQVKYEFIPNGYKGITIDPDGIFRNSYANTKKNQSKRRVGKPYVYPSIVFRVSKLGVVR